jgi:hypothetical protein
MGRGGCGGGSPNSASLLPFLSVWHCQHDGMWSGGWGYLGGINVGVALENVADMIDDLLAGEVHIVGGHGPCEPPWLGVRIGRHWSEGCGEGWQQGEVDTVEDRWTMRHRCLFYPSVPGGERIGDEGRQHEKGGDTQAFFSVCRLGSDFGPSMDYGKDIF